MTEQANAVPRVSVLAHPGQADVSRLCALEKRVATLEDEYRELLDLVHRMTQVAALERDAVRDRVRELELAHE